ncbi:GNAT family N-acetyltransferase [Actinomadura roseirufa]|uniref:GNAT family N-acetyltransferase n=1 Tax=Actinomadura roseirufa TaxID=2094049 RepID=UPI0010418395|nr:GNAT family N-acetyltransferase [Actinomadura roseirufa]
MTLDHEVIGDVAGLRSAGPAWIRLAERHAVTPFQTYQWNLAWWRFVGRHRPDHRPRVLVFRRDGVVCAVAPLMVRGGAGETELCMLSDPYADYPDVLIDPARASPAEVSGRVLRYAREGLGREWDRVALAELPSWPGLSAALTAGRPWTTTTASPCYRLDLRDRDAVARIEHARQYTYRQRRLDRLGTSAFHLHVDAAEIAARMPTLIALHLRQWVHREDSEITFDDADMVRFYTGAVSWLADAGLLMLADLTLDGRSIAFHLGFTYRDTFWAYRTTYDAEFRRLSPGHLMNRRLIIGLRAAGFHTLDLMRGETPYKLDYATHKAENTTISLP